MTQQTATPRFWRLRPLAAAGLVFMLVAPTANSYSVLTHEAIVDSVWDSAIKPLLLQRFPAATPDELKKAHAFAYGGSIIQDLGYYPFGSKFFSDLTHYVRSGDFILNLIRDSQDVNELAFSLGALSHYAADNDGHRLATNRAVPLLYPKLGVKFGKSITYGDDPFSHLRTEFGFDVFQAAKGRYAPDGYKDFIGFEVARRVLDQAFQETYGLKLSQVFINVDLVIGSYRHSVSSIMPAMTRVAWQIKKEEITKEVPGMTRKKFLYNLSRSSYETNWGSTYVKPGVRSRILAFFFRIVPRIGPFKALAFKKLTPETEQLYMTSFNAAVDRYRKLLAGQGNAQFELLNENLDTGEVTKAGEYKLTDAAYAKLLDKLKDRYAEVPPELRGNILAFYRDLGTPAGNDSAVLLKELDMLKAVNVEPSGQR